VKRLLAFGLGAFGVRALLRHRRSVSAPADELREKLAAQRSAVDESPPVAPDEPEATAEPEAGGVDARRADVHARARQQIDELSGR
jgi:hypothetical protein